MVKDLPAKCRRHETWVQTLGREDPLEEGMATHSSILVWRIVLMWVVSHLGVCQDHRFGLLRPWELNQLLV